MAVMAAEWTGGDLSLRWPWLVVALSAVTVVLLVVWFRTWRRRTPSDAAYVAHADRLRSLPRYRSLVRGRVVLGVLTSLATLVALVGAVILSGRVEETQTKKQDENARDIMLCLDASGSMAPYNVDVLEEMQDIVKGLEGERIGLAIWSKATITVFPLTDDYDYALEKLEEAEGAFEAIEDYPYVEEEDVEKYFDFVAGTQRLDGNATVASQIGDGLASCVQRFGDLDEKRGRAVILASDNEPIGKGVFTLEDSADYAIEHKVVVHGIGTEGFEDDDELDDFDDAVVKTGGIFGEVDSGDSADHIVAEINELEAAKLQKPPLVQTLDRPRLGTIIAGIGVGMLLLLWLWQSVATVVRRAR